MNIAILFAVFGSIFGLASATIGVPVVIGEPQQVHISYGLHNDQIWVTWLTFESTTSYKLKPTVQYGLEHAKLDATDHGYATHFMNGNRTAFVHRVQLSKLKPSTVYYYRCGTEKFGWTKVFSFKTRPQDEEHWQPILAIYGDLGIINGVSIDFIKDQVAKNAYDCIFHVGDMAYNLPDINGEIGDEFMKEMEPAMAQVPYQVAPGNHEHPDNFTQYVSRFTMINSDNEINNHFYSFNMGPMHIISYSSEFYFYLNYGSDQIVNQFKWLEEDLKEATKPENRQKRPWIVAAAHRPMYCSNDEKECKQLESRTRKGYFHQYGLEDLFYKYGVDILIGAHEHSYERLFPVYDRKVYNGSIEEPYRNPKAPIHFVTGSAGCEEEIDVFKKQPSDWSAKRIPDYGITEFQVLNKTHVHLRQLSTVKNGQVVDEVYFIKEKHGPEAWL